jgi:transposase
MNEDSIIGFLDETSPQATANTQRLWSFERPTIYKNTTKLRANTFGFYALNGNSLIEFREHSKKEDVCQFLREVRYKNPEKEIIVILDNFSSHKAKDTVQCAEDFGIDLIYLPPYSPDLNPIEFIWKSIKRVISRKFIANLDHMKNLIRESFSNYSSRLSFANRWIEKFLDERNRPKILGS